MAQAAFKKGRTNRKRCKAMKRDGTPCGMLAMTRYGLEGLRGARGLRSSGAHDEAQADAEISAFQVPPTGKEGNAADVDAHRYGTL